MTAQGRRRRRAACVIALVAGVGCGPQHGAAFPAAMKDADLAAEHGDKREAARLFDRAAELALLPRDRDDARHAAARMWARAGDVPRALATLDALASESPPGVEAGSAFYDAASLRIAAGDTETGWRDLERMVHRFPNDGDARPALHRWLLHLDDADADAGSAHPRSALDWLRGVHAELDTTDRSEEVAYEVAVRLERTGDASSARDAFLAVAARWPYPLGALWDDALYHASVIDEARGHADDAARDLRRMLDGRERAVIIGSAERSRYAEAELHLGELYRDRLSDRGRARAAFHALYTDFPESPLRERGLFEEARLLEADGEQGEACARLELLVREFPGSRYAPCAVTRCPAIQRRPDRYAPATCHPYIDAPAPSQ